MPHPTSRRGGRADAEQRYRDLRRLALDDAQERLAASGISAELRPIDASALEAFGTWRNRRVAWPWPDMAGDWRRNHPDRFEVAVWRNGVLCGLALGKPAPSRSHLSLHYMEGDPDPGHPLQGQVTAATFAAASSYAIALPAKELHLVEPFPALVPRYCGPPFHFELVQPKGRKPYCRRSP